MTKGDGETEVLAIQESLSENAEFVSRAPNRFRVHTKAYTDPDVFAAEMDRIFTKTWVYVGHDTEVPNPGDYRTSYIGLQPVIMSRGYDKKVNVLVNRCVHRGAVVCVKVTAMRKNSTAPIMAGSSVLTASCSPCRSARTPVVIPTISTHQAACSSLLRSRFIVGSSFASFNPDVPDLLHFLGRAKTLIDRKVDMSAGRRDRSAFAAACGALPGQLEVPSGEHC